MLVLHSRSAESLELPLACLVIKIEEDNQKSLTRMLSYRHMETPLWRKKSKNPSRCICSADIPAVPPAVPGREAQLDDLALCPFLFISLR